MKDLMNAFIAEQFFHIDEHTTKMLSTVPNVIQNLYLESEQALIYIDELCFLVEKVIDRAINGFPVPLFIRRWLMLG